MTHSYYKVIIDPSHFRVYRVGEDGITCDREYLFNEDHNLKVWCYSDDDYGDWKLWSLGYYKDNKKIIEISRRELFGLMWEKLSRGEWDNYAS